MIDGNLPASIHTVTGPLAPGEAGVVDGHNHVWINDVESSDPSASVLNDFSEIAAELSDYREAGGETLIDCQPGGCGRNGHMLRRLSEKSRVKIVASTGFHLRRYYPEEAGIFQAGSDAACSHFVQELTDSLEETWRSSKPVRAGLIKIACEEALEQSPLHLIEAAVGASLETNAAIEVHTEKGAGAEQIARFMLDAGLPARKLILCHMDKRPDFALHRSLAQEGIALEYDTFFRPKYHPNENVWPLLNLMIEADLEDNIVVATDMAGAATWQHLGAGPGLTGLLTTIIPRLMNLGHPSSTVRKLTGENITSRLARADIQKELRV